MDEKKDLEPLLKARDAIDIFLDEYPDTDYATDLSFKRGLVQNQLAAKELFVARYYISVKKWIPAINRLKIITEKYDTTIFIEEALHRLVEIYYYLGLENEAKQYAAILGYNYKSTEWYERTFELLKSEGLKPKSSGNSWLSQIYRQVVKGQWL